MNNPDPTWIETNVWGEIRALCGLDFFAEFAASFTKQAAKWRRFVRMLRVEEVPKETSF